MLMLIAALVSPAEAHPKPSVELPSMATAVALGPVWTAVALVEQEEASRALAEAVDLDRVTSALDVEEARIVGWGYTSDGGKGRYHLAARAETESGRRVRVRCRVRAEASLYEVGASRAQETLTALAPACGEKLRAKSASKER